jgi:hypothetical protein
MNFWVSECYTRMWADRFHRVEFRSISTRPRDGANIVQGWMRADTPDAVRADPSPSDVPFRIAIPAGLNEWDFHVVNTDIFYRLINGVSLMDLDYAPPPPDHAETDWGGAVFVGLLGLGVFALARGSRS